MDGAETGTVAGSHVLVESLNSLGTAHLTELLVHVVGTGARVVADPDTEVLDLQVTLLGDDIEADDLTVGLLDLTELGQEVPEPGLGHDSVRRKDAHAVKLGRGVSLGGQMTPDDLVLGETPYNNQSVIWHFQNLQLVAFNHPSGENRCAEFRAVRCQSFRCSRVENIFHDMRP